MIARSSSTFVVRRRIRRASPHRPRSGATTRRWARRALAALVVVALSTATTTTPAAGEARYRPPVDSPPVDLFRPPSHPFGPGNRGLEYHPPVDAPVWAAASGQVVFAGPVAGALHVTVLHPDGLRTSYSFLASIEVALGQGVGQGDTLGLSSGLLHFGVRSGTTYLDPLALFAPGPPAVHLVADPTDDGPAVEAASLIPVVVDALVGDRWPVARHYLLETDLDRRLARVTRRVIEAWRSPAPCSAASFTPPRPSGSRFAVLVGGFASTSTTAAVDEIDSAGLGYRAEDVIRFSYAGGRTPGRPPAGPLTGIAATSYDAARSQGDLRAAAGRLRILLAEVASARPGVPIDVIAHSQGGVLVQVALTDLATGPAVPGAVDLVVTLGSPHQGTDLATAIAAVHDAPAAAAALDLLAQHLTTGLDPGSPAPSQLSEVSTLMADLRRAPPPEGVRLLTLAARGDLVVPAIHTRLWGASHRTVDLVGPAAHAALPGHESTTREVALALAGAPPTCRDGLDVVLDETLPEGISFVEDTLGAAAWAAASLADT